MRRWNVGGAIGLLSWKLFFSHQIHHWKFFAWNRMPQPVFEVVIYSRGLRHRFMPKRMDVTVPFSLEHVETCAVAWSISQILASYCFTCKMRIHLRSDWDYERTNFEQFISSKWAEYFSSCFFFCISKKANEQRNKHVQWQNVDRCRLCGYENVVSNKTLSNSKKNHFRYIF